MVADTELVLLHVYWDYSFKWALDQYSQRAKELINLIEFTCETKHDGIDETADGGMVLFLYCSPDEIESIISDLNNKGYYDWSRYTWIDPIGQQHVALHHPYE
jgi:hypothetical protein